MMLILIIILSCFAYLSKARVAQSVR